MTKWANFMKVFIIFVYFGLNIFAKMKINSCKNAKTKIFVSTLFTRNVKYSGLPSKYHWRRLVAKYHQVTFKDYFIR
jgi:hypothetical protein